MALRWWQTQQRPTLGREGMPSHTVLVGPPVFLPAPPPLPLLCWPSHCAGHACHHWGIRSEESRSWSPHIYGFPSPIWSPLFQVIICVNVVKVGSLAP